jgi:hypothetical protein
VLALFRSQAVAPGHELAGDFLLGGPEGGALQLGGEHEQMLPRARFRALTHVQLGDHPGLRRQHPDDALLRHQPAVDARLARVVGVQQER